MAMNNGPLPLQNELHCSPQMFIDSSKPSFRIWKAINIVAVTYALVFSSYLFGFAKVISRVYNIVDIFICILFLIDIIVSFLANYIDNRTNTHVKGWRMRLKMFFLSWGAIRLIGIVPAIAFRSHAAKFVYIAKVVHIGEILKATSHLKMDKYRKINACIKWARRVFVILFSIHLIACIFYHIGTTNTSNWITLGEEQRKNERYKGFFDYMISMYWSATVFTTVGYGDYHAVNGYEMAFSVIAMLFYPLVQSYMSQVLSELLQECRHKKKIREVCEALRNFAITHHLQVGLHQDMYNSLIKSHQNPKSFNIQALFPRHIQIQVKSAFSANIAQAYLFDGVSDNFTYLLVAEMELETFEAHEIVLMANDYYKKLYILIQGGIEGTSLTNPDLRVCGEFGVIFGLPQSYRVRTNQKSTLFSLSQERFNQLMQLNRQDGRTIASNILKYLGNQRADPILDAIYTQVTDKFNRGEVNLHLDIRFACRWVFPKLLSHLIKSGEFLEETFEQQRNILHIAIAEGGEQGDESCLRILLTEIRFTSINQKDSYGQTPLFYVIAKEKPSLSLIDLFRQRNVGLEHDDVASYYSKAITTDNIDLLVVLPQLGADINIADNIIGSTPLHIAVQANKPNMVTALLNLGANQNLVDNTGHTPLEWAQFSNYLDIVALLQAHAQ